MHIVISLGFCGMMSSISAIVLGNMVAKVNEGICVCWRCRWGVIRVSETYIKGGDIIFWLIWGFCDLDRIFTFQCGSEWYSCGGLWGCGCWVEVMVLELDSAFGGYFCLELSGVKEWTSGGLVSMVDVTGGFLEGAAVSDVSWIKSQMSISSISSLALASKISFIPFAMVKTFWKSENSGRDCDTLMCSRNFSGLGSHLNGDILIVNIEVIP